jgi:hypothetical protein
MTSARDGRVAGHATVSFVDPLETPFDFGVDRFRPSLSDGSPMPAAVERGLRELHDAAGVQDEAAARSVARDLGHWWGDHERYEVLGAGEGHVDVPALVAAAPPGAEAEVTTSFGRADAHGSTLELKVAGNGLSADAKVTVTDTSEITASDGETQVLSVSLPVAWEARLVRRDGQHEPMRQLVVLPRRVDGPLDLAVRVVEHAPVLVVQKSFVVDLREAGHRASSFKREVSIEASGGFSVGFTAFGMDATLTVTREASLDVTMCATLPAGIEYQIDWLAAPPGVRVVPRTP